MKAGWTVKRLEDVAAVSAGNPAPQDKALFDGGILPFFRTSDVGRVRIGRLSDSEDHLNAKGIHKLKLHRAGTILLPKSGASTYLDHRVIMDVDGYVSSHLATVFPKSNVVDGQFLFYALLTVSARELSADSSYPTLSLKQVQDIEIVLPPLDEQRRIVAVLDKAFAGIATATANAQKNQTNARALFDGYLQSIFSKKGDGWKDMTLGKACKVERGSSPRPIKSFVTTENDGQNWIKIGDTKNDSKYVTQTKQRITPNGALKSRRVDPGDFILTNSMSFGKPYIMKISGYIHDGWFALRLGDGIDTEYFYYLLSSPIVQTQFQNLAAGAIVLNISGDLVKKAILPIPPVEQQREIVKRIQLVDDKTSNLGGIYENKLTALTELKQSLLHKAFAGELT